MPAKTEALRALLNKYIRLTKQYTGEYKTLKSLRGKSIWILSLSDNDYTLHTCMHACCEVIGMEIELFHMDAMPVEIS